VAAGVIDHIDLAGIETGFERGQRHVQLKDSRLSLARIQFRQLDQRTFVGFGLPWKNATLVKSRMPACCSFPLSQQFLAPLAGIRVAGRAGS
jgi:hypothetical protein